MPATAKKHSRLGRIPLRDPMAPPPVGVVKPLILSILVFILLAIAVHFVADTERDRVERELRAQVTREIVQLRSRLEAEINADAFLANGMMGFVTAVSDGNGANIQAALKALYQFGRHIRNVGVAPGNRLTYIYPLEGNQQALGAYYPDLPGQWPAVERAIAAHDTVLAGPVNLVQGGFGLISRTPVFHDDGSYWGLLSIVLDADRLFRGVGMAPEADGLLLAMRGKDGLGEKGEVFFGDADLFDQDSLRHPLPVPGGSWQIAAMPAKGWRQGQQEVTGFEILALGVSLILAGAAFGYQRGRLRIEASERRLRTFLQTTRDGVVVIDDRGLIHEFNPAAVVLFGFTPGEVVGTSITHLMPVDIAARQRGDKRNATGVRARYAAAPRQVSASRKDGTQFPVEVTFGEAVIAGRRIHVGVVRDVTEHKELERKLMELATTDGLTGALNRRAILESAEDSFRLARRYGHPLSVLMIDADYFKRVNDTFGHPVGDAVLVRLAALARDSLRTTDRFGRFGGEEFVALLAETDVKHAEETAERLLAAVRAAEIDNGHGGVLKLTVSIGVAALTPDTPNAAALIQQADEALYRAKGEGRDRWCGAAGDKAA